MLKAHSGKTNIQFVESRITEIALASGVTECIIPNCVINLVPQDEKQLMFNLIFRLLKSRWRVAISDILAKKPFPEEIRQSIGL
ncbi:putative arsenite methyltransferase [Tolypocladium ophioglossoides CBS 100239]|uniref:Putative arsenite methyltransferase n=1 Tax=Tolypocladium ophioglossoides (strain CBS 100239) TaxID=1163406 RepID=A0A0L0MWT7_TOLOC|nr:putative arsenite methyltransferase [Tolypocladium ophioglossoides CBS 100239]